MCHGPSVPFFRDMAGHHFSRHRVNPSPLLALPALPKPRPFVPGVELDVVCARQDLCQSLHLRSLTIEPLTAHRVACGGAPARQSDRLARGAVSPSRAELDSDWSSWEVCPPLRVWTHCAQLWTHSLLPRRSRYRTQALPKAPPPSDLTLLRTVDYHDKPC